MVIKMSDILFALKDDNGYYIAIMEEDPIKVFNSIVSMIQKFPTETPSMLKGRLSLCIVNTSIDLIAGWLLEKGGYIFELDIHESTLSVYVPVEEGKVYQYGPYEMKSFVGPKALAFIKMVERFITEAAEGKLTIVINLPPRLSPAELRRAILAAVRNVLGKDWTVYQTEVLTEKGVIKVVAKRNA